MADFTGKSWKIDYLNCSFLTSRIFCWKRLLKSCSQIVEFQIRKMLNWQKQKYLNNQYQVLVTLKSHLIACIGVYIFSRRHLIFQ